MADADRVVVGRIGRPHGVRGEVTMLPTTDDPARFVPGAELLTDDGRALVVVAAHPYRDRGLRVHFAGVDSRSDAEALRGATVTAPVGERRNLDADEFWPEDLIGLRAISPGGVVLGMVTAVDFGVGQDRIVVTTPSGDEVLVPFVADLVGDPTGDHLEVRDPGGLFPD